MGSPESEARPAEETGWDFSRTVAFTDGVFAIAITLLVLTIEIPGGGDLGDELRERSEQFFAYFLSFAVLGRMWLGHHRFYGLVRGFDGHQLGLNIVYLAFVCLLPLTTDVLGNYGADSVAVAIYAANMLIISVLYQLQVRHAYSAGLTRPEAEAKRREYLGVASWDVVITFAVSIPVAFIDPLAGMSTWVALFVLGRALERAN